VVSSPAFADGQLAGRVLDLNNQPVKDASVIVSGPSGNVELTVTTDPTGHYAATVPGGEHTVIFAFGDTKVTARVVVPDAGSATLDTTLEIGSEIINVYDAPRPIKYAKPRQDPLLIRSTATRSCSRTHGRRRGCSSTSTSAALSCASSSSSGRATTSTRSRSAMPST
jgi:hypothetical protein